MDPELAAMKLFLIKGDYMGYVQKLPAETDWKLFRKKLPGWQEACMDRLNKEYMEILSQEDRNPSDRFWELEKRVHRDKKLTGVLARDVKRSNMDMLIMNLLAEGTITLDDLSDFTEELQEKMRWISARWETE